MIQIRQFYDIGDANRFLAVLQDSDVKKVEFTSVLSEDWGDELYYTITYSTLDPAIQENMVLLKKDREARDELDK